MSMTGSRFAYFIGAIIHLLIITCDDDLDPISKTKLAKQELVWIPIIAIIEDIAEKLFYYFVN